MTVSRADTELIVEIITNYVEPERIDALLKDLESVSGNASYRETVARIREIVKRRRKT